MSQSVNMEHYTSLSRKWVDYVKLNLEEQLSVMSVAAPKLSGEKRVSKNEQLTISQREPW